MNSAKRLLMVAGAFALATLTFTLANPKAVHAFAATLVQVVNTPQNPVPVQDTRITSSSILTVQAGQTTAATTLTVPTCSNGNEFLLTALNAAPDFLFSPDVTQLHGTWGVFLDVVQIQNGGTARSARPLTVYGNGLQNVSATLPAGQPSFFSGSAGLLLQLFDGPAAVNIDFDIHATGYCGTPFVTP